MVWVGKRAKAATTDGECGIVPACDIVNLARNEKDKQNNYLCKQRYLQLGRNCLQMIQRREVDERRGWRGTG